MDKIPERYYLRSICLIQRSVIAAKYSLMTFLMGSTLMDGNASIVLLIYHRR
ncbi:MAG: hypothetical protein IPJ46_11210 [Anaerolineales bacterium]|nr:hypothetical protein [Anaerolineales bacterium]